MCELEGWNKEIAFGLVWCESREQVEEKQRWKSLGLWGQS